MKSKEMGFWLPEAILWSKAAFQARDPDKRLQNYALPKTPPRGNRYQKNPTKHLARTTRNDVH